MHLNKIFDLGYDLVPTITASLVVLIAVLRDVRRKHRR
jgi:hypothetical protein